MMMHGVCATTTAVLLAFGCASTHAAQLAWTVKPYSDLTVPSGEGLAFSCGGLHNVVEVSKANYDSCNANGAVAFWGKCSAGKPVTVPASSLTGTHYFICTEGGSGVATGKAAGEPAIGGHCFGGQKVTVKKATPTASAPTTPVTVPWVIKKYDPITVPKGTSVEFTCAGMTHNVIRVSKADYNACRVTKALGFWGKCEPNKTVTVPGKVFNSGTKYFICTEGGQGTVPKGIAAGEPARGGHCRGGQKITIRVK